MRNRAVSSLTPVSGRSRPYGYAVALGAVVLTTLGVEVLIPDVGHRYPFFTYFPALLIGSSVGGFFPGLAAVSLSELLLWFIWLDPETQHGTSDALAVAVFFVTGIGMAWVMELTHRTRDSLENALAKERRTQEQLRQHAEEVSALTDALREEDRRKDMFLANVSHELRTPLNVVMGRLQMLRLITTNERPLQMLDVIQRNATIQMQLIEQLLESQRIVHDRFELRCEMVRLDCIAQSVVNDLRVAPENDGVHFACRLDPICLLADGQRVRQVFSNLLDNALKFTTAPGCIGLTVKRLDSMALVEVVDSGIGIAPDFLPHVFERFRQADQSYARQHQHGLGLGLAIVKATVEAHGGSVSVASDGVGRGAKFSIYLPIRESRTHPMMGDERAQDLAS